MITVYSKPDCMQCRMTYTVLESKGLPYRVVDVTENADALSYVKELGYMTAPVVVASEHDHWGGFQPDQIARLAAGDGTEDENAPA